MSAILIVHPDGKTRDAVGAILEQGGHQVFSASDGPRAMAAFARRRPDIVIVNHTLPSTASFQVFAEIRRLDPQVKVLLFALRGSDADERASEAFGVRGFRPSEVLRVIEGLHEGESIPRKPAGPARRVLVVDDELSVREPLRRFLAERGYEVALCSNGLDALSQLHSFAPHLVLLDVEMPVMDGIETLKHIREADTQVGVVMITGHDEFEIMESCRSYGAYDYLVKPFDFQYLEFSVYSKIFLMNS